MLKPSDLGVTGTVRTISQHKDLVLRNLKRLSNKFLGRVCTEILQASPGDKIDIGNLNTNIISSIKNFFSEVSGPIWIQEKGLLGNFRPSDKLFYSSSSNERLYDFIMYKGEDTILVSNKQSKGTTNTLKPDQVIDLVDRDDGLSKKWKHSIQYNVFETLDRNNVILGPIKAIADYYPNYLPISRSDYLRVMSQMSSNDAVIHKPPASFMSLIRNNPDTLSRLLETGEVSGKMINFLFEKVLIQQSVDDPKYNELFLDITDGNIFLLKFDLNTKGIIDYGIFNPRKSSKRAVLRSKQGVHAIKNLGKLGFQIP